MKTKRTIGQAIEILAYTAAWFSILNTLLIIILSYDKVKSILTETFTFVTNWSWFTLPIFFIIILVPIIVIYGLEWFILYPARQKFRNEQEVESGSPILEEIKKLKEEIQNENKTPDAK